MINGSNGRVFLKTYFEVLDMYAYDINRDCLKDAYLVRLSSINVKILTTLGRLGYADKFRFGTSLMTLIISRSSAYGLRENQPRIVFEVTPSSPVVTIKLYDPKSKSFDNIEGEWRYLYKDVSFFERLLSYEID